VANARTQLGWEPAYGSVRGGIERYAADVAAFLG
jgi:hypothetical protein